MTKIQYLTTIDCFQGYILYRKEYNYHADQSWFSITATDIDEYVMTDHYCNYTNRHISNSVQCTQNNCITATPSGKCLYPNTTYQSMLLDESQYNTIYQTTAQVHVVEHDPNVEYKSNGIKVIDISTDLFLNPLCEEIVQVINCKICRNINTNQSECSTSIMRILNTHVITKSSTGEEKLNASSQSVITLSTTLVL